jgi:hypothetical protein
LVYKKLALHLYHKMKNISVNKSWWPSCKHMNS